MQSSLAVAGMPDAAKNILTRRANQRHYSIITPFVKRSWLARGARPCPENPEPSLREPLRLTGEQVRNQEFVLHNQNAIV
jgi:hypothetical protein